MTRSLISRNWALLACMTGCAHVSALPEDQPPALRQAVRGSFEALATCVVGQIEQYTSGRPTLRIDRAKRTAYVEQSGNDGYELKFSQLIFGVMVEGRGVPTLFGTSRSFAHLWPAVGNCEGKYS